MMFRAESPNGATPPRTPTKSNSVCCSTCFATRRAPCVGDTGLPQDDLRCLVTSFAKLCPVRESPGSEISSDLHRTFGPCPHRIGGAICPSARELFTVRTDVHHRCYPPRVRDDWRAG